MNDTRSNEKPKEAAVRDRHYIPDDYKGGADRWLTNNSSNMQETLINNSIVKIDLEKHLKKKMLPMKSKI